MACGSLSVPIDQVRVVFNGSGAAGIAAPRVAMLSFSNFDSTRHPLSEKVQRAVKLAQEADPTLMIDGEMMADTAVAPEIIEETYRSQSCVAGRTCWSMSLPQHQNGETLSCASGNPGKSGSGQDDL